MSSAKELRDRRLNKWLDMILINLKDIETSLDDIEANDYKKARSEILEQYRLIRLMKNVLDGKSKLDGWS